MADTGSPFRMDEVPPTEPPERRAEACLSFVTSLAILVGVVSLFLWLGTKLARAVGIDPLLVKVMVLGFGAYVFVRGLGERLGGRA